MIIDICVLRKESRFWERILNFRYIFGTIGLSTRTTVSDKLNAMFRDQHDINMNCIFDDLRVNDVDKKFFILYRLISALMNRS